MTEEGAETTGDGATEGRECVTCESSVEDGMEMGLWDIKTWGDSPTKELNDASISPLVTGYNAGE